MGKTARESALAYLAVLGTVIAAVAVRTSIVPGAAATDVVEAHLERELRVRVGAVLEWEQARRADVERVADDATLRGRLGGEPTGGQGAPLDALLGSLCAELVGCTLSRPDGSVLASYVGREVPRALVLRAAQGRTVHSKLVATDALGRLDPRAEDARFAVFFATPIVEGGQVRAVLTGRVKPDEDLGAILGDRPPGRTGETYAVDPRGYMVTRSRFDAQGQHPSEAPRVLGAPGTWLRTPTGMPTRPLATLQRSGVDVDGYRDYRGVRVVGAWRWLDDLGAGVVTEMDHAEAVRIESSL